jgi:hypothetical protein
MWPVEHDERDVLEGILNGIVFVTDGNGSDIVK